MRDGEAEQFCCEGCRTARAVISGCGLESYYKFRQTAGDPGSPAKNSGRTHSEFDDPTFRSLYCRMGDDGLTRTQLMLSGVHCAACVWLVERLPRIAPGVVEARLDMRRAVVHLAWDDETIRLSRVARALDSLGYTPHPVRGGSRREARLAEDRAMLVRLGVAGACAGNVMLLAFALYAGLFDAMEPLYRHTFRWMSMGISVVSLAWPGRVFFKGAWAALRARTVHLDIPIALGLGAGAIWGIVSTVRGVGEIYFDSLSVLVFVLLIGRLIQQRQQRWSSDALELLFSLTPSTARRITDEGIEEVHVESLGVGDVVEVRAGDSFPVDGRIIDGVGSVDESLLTGESRPVRVGIGDSIHAGSVNLVSPLRVEVCATGESTRVGRLMKLVEEGASRRAPIVKLADKIAGWFVLGMIALACVTAGVWLWIEPSRAIDNAAALLIVTCPCALGLATPLAVTVMIGRAARRGILIKSGEAIQSLAAPGAMLLDKTGTITEARTSLIEWVGPEWIKPLVAAIESGSSHPIARALVRDCQSPGTTCTAGQIVSTSRGIEGIAQGRRIAIGSAEFIRSIDNSGAMLETERDLAARGLTPVLIAADSRIVGIAGMGDPIRRDAKDAIRALEHAGWEVRILSGDHADVVAGAARELGIASDRAIGGATPEMKLARVEEASHAGPVVMVGDGANDAAALAAASVGIAVHGGAEASLAAADVYLSRPGLGPIVELTRAARATMRTIKISLGVSLLYNAASAGLAVTGLINPLMAAILMPLSSLTVLTISLRARTFARSGSDSLAARANGGE